MQYITEILNNPFVLYPLLIWSLFWKAWALWRAARLTHYIWYFALLVVNTLGILEIIYLVYYRDTYIRRFSFRYW